MFSRFLQFLFNKYRKGHSIPTWMLTKDEISDEARALMLSAGAPSVGPITIERGSKPNAG